MLSSSESIEVPASVHSPAYIIHPFDGGDVRSAGIPILVGENLSTTSLTLGKPIPNRSNAIRLRIKSDHPAGAMLSLLEADSIYDVSGSVGGKANFFEFLKVDGGNFVCRVDIGHRDDLLHVTQIVSHGPSLVLSRKDMFGLGFGNEFIGGIANPHFGPVPKIPHRFDELVKLVREHVAAACYRIL